MKELAITIFVDLNHAHDLVTGISITGMICFVERTPIIYISERQSAAQTPTFGTEFVALKKAVEEAVTLRYCLRAMGVNVSKRTVIYGDNMSIMINSTKPGSPLKKKYLALSYHFCREHFSAGVVDIRKNRYERKLCRPIYQGPSIVRVSRTHERNSRELILGRTSGKITSNQYIYYIK